MVHQGQHALKLPSGGAQLHAAEMMIMMIMIMMIVMIMMIMMIMMIKMIMMIQCFW